MIIPLRRMLERAAFIMLFLTFTYMVYHGLGYLSAMLQPTERYQTPNGQALKVFGQYSGQTDGLETVKERLMLFYQYGE